MDPNDRETTPREAEKKEGLPLTGLTDSCLERLDGCGRPQESRIVIRMTRFPAQSLSRLSPQNDERRNHPRTFCFFDVRECGVS